MPVDYATLNFDKLMFARVFVDMKINEDYPDYISFINENDNLIKLSVLYDWKPILCQHCAQFGHTIETCKKAAPSQQVSEPNAASEVILEVVRSNEHAAVHSDVLAAASDHMVDEEGFQEVRARPRREGVFDPIAGNETSNKEATVMMTSNGIEVLGIFDDATHNNLVLGTIPHQSND